MSVDTTRERRNCTPFGLGPADTATASRSIQFPAASNSFRLEGGFLFALLSPLSQNWERGRG